MSESYEANTLQSRPGKKKREGDRRGGWIYHSPMLTFIHRDRRRDIMTSVRKEKRKKKAERLFKLKGRGEGRRENGGEGGRRGSEEEPGAGDSLGKVSR